MRKEANIIEKCHDKINKRRELWYHIRVPRLIRQSEKLSLCIPNGLSFDGFIMGSTVAAQFLYQLKMFVKWDAKKAYEFYKFQRVEIDFVNKNRFALKCAPKESK